MSQLCVAEKYLPIFALEAEIFTFPQIEIPVEHEFCNGLYARTMRIPAKTILTGAIHREESFFLIRSGKIAVTTDAGPVIIEAGHMSACKVGTKRAGIALTDVICTTFHANPLNETEPEALWDMYTIPPDSELLAKIEDGNKS